MITNEEALKTVKSLHDNYCAEAVEDLVDYIAQEEKVSKLLELKNKLLYEYDEIFLKALGDHFYLLDSKQYIEDCKRTHKIHNEIKALEEELK